MRPVVVLALVGLTSAVAHGFGRFSYALLLPAIDRDLLGSYSLAGLLGTANLAAYLTGTLMVSGLVRWCTPRTLMLLGLGSTTLGLAALSRADSAVALAIGLSLAGLGGAFTWVPAPGLAGSVVSSARRGAAIGVAGAGVGLGIVVAGVLAAGTHRIGGDATWRTVWLVEALVALSALLLCWVFLRPRSQPVDGLPVRARALRQVPGWVALTAGYAAYGVAYSVYSTYLVTALQQDAGHSTAHASFDYTLLGLTHIAGGLVLGRLSDRLGRARTLTAGYAALAGSILLVLLGDEPFAATSAVVFGLLMSGIPAVIAAHLSDHLTPREFAGAFGRCTLFLGLAQMCGPPVGGWLAEVTGSFDAAFVLAALFAGAGLLSSRVLAGRPGRDAPAAGAPTAPRRRRGPPGR